MRTLPALRCVCGGPLDWVSSLCVALYIWFLIHSDENNILWLNNKCIVVEQQSLSCYFPFDKISRKLNSHVLVAPKSLGCF